MILLDIAPTLAMYQQTSEAFARSYWHWFFLIQPTQLPERAIEADPVAYIREVMGNRSAGLAPFDPPALAEYERCIRLKGAARGICEDYRADALQGIEHIIAPEHGMIRPGMVVICGDSHTTTYGALGALIAPDEKAIEYVFARASDMTETQREEALNYWATLHSDEGAEFDVEYTFDAQEVVPYVTWGTSPDQAIPITGKVPAADGPQGSSHQKAMDYTGLTPYSLWVSPLEPVGFFIF